MRTQHLKFASTTKTLVLAIMLDQHRKYRADGMS